MGIERDAQNKKVCAKVQVHQKGMIPKSEEESSKGKKREGDMISIPSHQDLDEVFTRRDIGITR